MKYYNETIRLAKLIGLDYHTEGCHVWRRDKHHHFVPWAPFVREADWEPIREWVQENHPCWDGWDWSSPAAYCRAVLDAFGDTRGPAIAIHGSVTSGFHFHGPFATVSDAEKWLEGKIVFAGSVVLLQPPERSE